MEACGTSGSLWQWHRQPAASWPAAAASTTSMYDMSRRKRVKTVSLPLRVLVLCTRTYEYARASTYEYVSHARSTGRSQPQPHRRSGLVRVTRRHAVTQWSRRDLQGPAERAWRAGAGGSRREQAVMRGGPREQFPHETMYVSLADALILDHCITSRGLSGAPAEVNTLNSKPGQLKQAQACSSLAPLPPTAPRCRSTSWPSSSAKARSPSPFPHWSSARPTSWFCYSGNKSNKITINASTLPRAPMSQSSTPKREEDTSPWEVFH